MLQIIEREETNDEILFKKLEKQGLDPYDEVHSKSFRRYKERFFMNLRDAISTRFDECFSNTPEVDEILRQAEALLDDLTSVLDDVVPCFPSKYGVF